MITHRVKEPQTDPRKYSPRISWVEPKKRVGIIALKPEELETPICFIVLLFIVRAHSRISCRDRANLKVILMLINIKIKNYKIYSLFHTRPLRQSSFKSSWSALWIRRLSSHKDRLNLSRIRN